MMKSTVKLFMVLVIVTVVVLRWITGQYRGQDYMILILVLISATLLTFLLLNIIERRVQERRRKGRESRIQNGTGAEGSFALREKKSGLSWGGGNNKASEATRGTKRRFLGK